MESNDILIVDDDSVVFKLISRCLENFVYKLSFAQSGEEALKLISEKSFKVIISDIKMAKMDGFELLDKVHDLNRNITRIVLSAHSDIEFILKLVNQKGIERYLPKPFENADLILAIEKCIELYDLRNQTRMITSGSNA